jgi:hypothetical protein
VAIRQKHGGQAMAGREAKGEAREIEQLLHGGGGENEKRTIAMSTADRLQKVGL